MVEGSLKELPKPIKSAKDVKEYKVIQLPNGLRALLVSDTSYDLEKLNQEEDELVENVFADNDDDSEGEEEEEEDLEDEEEGEEEEEEDLEGEEEEDEDDEEEEEEEEDDEDGKAKGQAQVTSGLKKSAAGLCIGMGSFSDPQDLPGLAHFLEHMVFMGSKKYPSENGFDKFISKHGGFDNAHTDCEHTTFYFEVQRRHFPAALDMFAQFFIEPLMRKKAMKRERESVDSEFQMALPSDYFRKQQIFGAIAKANHPMAKFMWGNKDSLLLGKQHDDAVHEKLHAFKDRHYTSQSMTLVVQSQETIETLEKLVKDTFAAVPNNGLPRESFSHLQMPFDNPDFNKIYKVAPLENVYSLELLWSLPPMLDKYKAKPLEYLSWIIGHEGKGSLILYLRKKIWALSLYAGCEGDGFEMNSTHAQFTITITLTQQGFEEVDQVLKAVFTYLKMLRDAGPNQRIFNEIKEINDLNFKYKEESQPMDNVETLAENMQLYPPELYIAGAELMLEYDPDLITDCMKFMTSENACIFFSAREFADECDQIEPWFKTNYKVEEIPQEWREQWKNLSVDPRMFLPHPNIFIAKDLELKKVEDCGAFPSKLEDFSYGELYYKFDTVFNQPRAMIKIHVIVPAIRDSLENAVCMDLLVSCLVQQMVKDTYPADLAQLESSIVSSERGFQISLSGLNDKLSLLLDTILKHFVAFEEYFEEEFFEAVRDQVKKNYYNTFIKPSKLVKELRLFMTQDVYRGTREKHRIVSGITNDQVKAFNRDMYKKPLFVQALVQGNMSPQEAKKVFEATAKAFKCTKNDSIQVPEIAVNKIPKESGTKILRVDSFNPKDNNTLITNYYQFGPGNMQNYVYLEVGNQIMEEPVFDTLRTKEQLGYSVFSMVRNTHGILGLSVTVNSQATKFSVNFVDERIEAFLQWFIEDKLANLTDEEFNLTIATLIKMKSQADVTLAEEVSRHWSEVTSREFLFDRHQQEIKLLESCGKDDMINFMTQLISGTNEHRRKLSVQVVGSDVIDEETLEDNPDETVFKIKYHIPEDEGAKETFISDIIDYKNSLETYPPHKIIE